MQILDAYNPLPAHIRDPIRACICVFGRSATPLLGSKIAGEARTSFQGGDGYMSPAIALTMRAPPPLSWMRAATPRTIRSIPSRISRSLLLAPARVPELSRRRYRAVLGAWSELAVQDGLRPVKR
jgi:hypothetical protein